MSPAVLSLIIFIACIALFIWDKLPMATTAILGCVLMVLFGVCEFKTAFGQFASSTVILTIGVMIIGAAIRNRFGCNNRRMDRQSIARFGNKTDCRYISGFGIHVRVLDQFRSSCNFHPDHHGIIEF